MQKVLILLLTLSLILVSCKKGEGADSRAQDMEYPKKEIVLVVPFGAGGSTDTGARFFAKTLGKYLPVPVVVTNVAGAAGTVAAQEIKKARPDGYKLLVTYAGYPVTHIMGNTDITYRDFKPVGQYLAMDTCVVLKADSQYKSLADLIAAAKANPGKIKFGAGYGTLAFFGALAMEQAANVDFNVVDIGGGKPKAPELLDGRVAAYFDPMSSVSQFIESGQFICAGIYARQRNDLYPEIPTMVEQGYVIVLDQQSGLWAPKETPGHVIQVLNEAMEKACQDPTLKKDFKDVYAKPVFRNSAEYAEYLVEEYKSLEKFGENLE